MRSDIQHVGRIACLLLAAAGVCFGFQEGDFVPTMRRGQFHGHRTHWHDVLASQCPRFGVDRIVAVPLPQPIGFQQTDIYKIQFTFDGERHITEWLHVLGSPAPSPPYVEIDLLRSGSELKGAKAAVFQLDPQDIQEHSKLVQEFHNATHWPKHLLVSYTWTTRHEVDVQRGLLVLFGAGGLAALLAGLSAVRTHKHKLREFLQDVAADGTGAGPSGKFD